MKRVLLLALALSACANDPAQFAGPPPEPEITVTRIARVFPLPGHNHHSLIQALTVFAEGRMDALHVAVPPGQAQRQLTSELIVAGVRPRKIRPGSYGEILAERYIATVPPCPPLNVYGTGFGANDTRPGFGCATLANIAAETSDPADLLGNAAAQSPDAQRAAIAVQRYRSLPEPKPSQGQLTTR